MKIEHFAFNVSDPVAIAKWYAEHLGMRIVSRFEREPFTHFLADDSGNVMIEIYNNPADQVPDYKNMDPLLIHLAFASDDPHYDKEMLMKAGCTLDSELNLPDGTHLVMLKDPWGFAIQLCKRAKPMLKMQQ
ncbi:MAG: VOC family protein [Marinilabiliaceae bacterium]|nr:VOC family protein [Marinilabiliaceae bacterium]